MSKPTMRTTFPPILRRSLLYETLRDGTLRLLDYNLVQTTLGMMIEPRTLVRAAGSPSVSDEDPYESGYTEFLPMQRVEMFSLLNFSGSQWPRNYNQ